MSEQIDATAAKKIYGWLPDLPDNRDVMYSSMLKVAAPLPSKIDLRLFAHQ